MKRTISPDYILYCIMVILPIYQDSFLNRFIGSAGDSLLPVLSLLVFFGILLYNGNVYVNETVSGLIKLGCWLFVVSLGGILVWCLLGNSIVLYGEMLPIKAVKVVVQYMAFPTYICVLLMLMKKLDFDKVFYPIYVCLILLTLICLVELTQSPYAFTQLHSAGVFPYYRVRLLTKESSWTTVMIFNYVILSIYYSIVRKKTIWLYTVALCSGILIVSSGSKTLFLVIGIMFFIYLMLNLKKMKKSAILGSCTILLCASVFLIWALPKLLASFFNDIMYFTSTATRSYTIIIGLMIGVMIPVGVGGAAYLGILPMFMNKFINLFADFGLNLNMNEVKMLINGSSDAGLTVKSGVFQYNMYWGILGTIYLFWILYKVLEKFNHTNWKHKNLLISLFVCNVILITFASSFSFEFFLVVIIMIYLAERPELAERFSG